MKLSMIVAYGNNRVIGAGGIMPWHIPADLKFFKAQTLGKPVIMGRKTLKAIGKPLPGRPNIVVTGNPDFTAEGVTVAATLDAAVAAAQAEARAIGAQEIMIIGGGQIYNQMVGRVARLYLTEIDFSLDGDTFFPDWRAAGAWTETWREHHPAQGELPAFDFVIYDRA